MTTEQAVTELTITPQMMHTYIRRWMWTSFVWCAKTMLKTVWFVSLIIAAIMAAAWLTNYHTSIIDFIKTHQWTTPNLTDMPVEVWANKVERLRSLSTDDKILLLSGCLALLYLLIIMIARFMHRRRAEVTNQSHWITSATDTSDLIIQIVPPIREELARLHQSVEELREQSRRQTGEGSSEESLDQSQELISSLNTAMERIDSLPGLSGDDINTLRTLLNQVRAIPGQVEEQRNGIAQHMATFQQLLEWFHQRLSAMEQQQLPFPNSQAPQDQAETQAAASSGSWNLELSEGTFDFSPQVKSNPQPPRVSSEEFDTNLFASMEGEAPIDLSESVVEEDDDKEATIVLTGGEDLTRSYGGVERTSLTQTLGPNELNTRDLIKVDEGTAPIPTELTPIRPTPPPPDKPPSIPKPLKR